jgi:GNAT superfamily N-acetyltransferase
MLSAPAPLSERHQLDAFISGEPPLDEWLKRRARANQLSDSSRTFVVCDDAAVVGYYCLAAGAIGRDDAPKALQRNRPDPIPVMVLGRLAIHQDHQQRGIGTALLQDAILRTLQTAEHVGITALLVHAISESARRFYLSRGFIESALQPMTLCLPLATVRRSLAEGA